MITVAVLEKISFDKMHQYIGIDREDYDKIKTPAILEGKNQFAFYSPVGFMLPPFDHVVIPAGFVFKDLDIVAPDMLGKKSKISCMLQVTSIPENQVYGLNVSIMNFWNNDEIKLVIQNISPYPIGINAGEEVALGVIIPCLDFSNLNGFPKIKKISKKKNKKDKEKKAKE